MNYSIRRSQSADALALGRLAQLDSRLYDGSECLVAETDLELVAALPLGGGAGFADPFRRTSEALELLALRRDQLGAACPPPRVSLLRRAARRLRRYRAPASA